MAYATCLNGANELHVTYLPRLNGESFHLSIRTPQHIHLREDATAGQGRCQSLIFVFLVGQWRALAGCFDHAKKVAHEGVMKGSVNGIVI